MNHQLNTDVKLTKCYHGDLISIGITGDEKEIGFAANVLYNFGITNSEPHYSCSSFCYVYTNEKKMLSGFTAYFMNKLDTGETENPDIEILAAKYAENFIENMETEGFLYLNFNDSIDGNEFRFSEEQSDHEAFDVEKLVDLADRG